MKREKCRGNVESLSEFLRGGFFLDETRLYYAEPILEEIVCSMRKKEALAGKKTVSRERSL